MVKNNVNRRDGIPAIGLHMPQVENKMKVSAEKHRPLRPAVRSVGGQTNVNVKYAGGTVLKSIIIPRHVVDRETLKTLDSGKTHHTKLERHTYICLIYTSAVCGAHVDPSSDDPPRDVSHFSLCCGSQLAFSLPLAWILTLQLAEHIHSMPVDR